MQHSETEGGDRRLEAILSYPVTPCLKKPNHSKTKQTSGSHTQTQDEYKLNICSAQVCPLSEFIPSDPEAMTPPLGTTRSRSTRDRIIVRVGCHHEPMNLHCGSYKVGGQGRVCKEFAGQKMRKEIRRRKEGHPHRPEEAGRPTQRVTESILWAPYSMMCSVQTVIIHHCIP